MEFIIKAGKICNFAEGIIVFKNIVTRIFQANSQKIALKRAAGFLFKQSVKMTVANSDLLAYILYGDMIGIVFFYIPQSYAYDIQIIG